MKNNYAAFRRSVRFLPVLAGTLLTLSSGSQAQAQAYDQDPTIGINNLTGFYPEQIDTYLSRMQTLGLKRVRMGMGGVHGFNQDAFNWAARDNAVNKYLAAGITMHSVISPREHVAHGDFNYNGISYDRWKANWAYYCRGVMTRYKGKINYYIIDNEPEAPTNSGAPLTPQQCVDLTKIAFDVARSIDANIKIESTPTKSTDAEYLRSLVSLGITRYCDYLGTHSYGSQADDGRLNRPWEFQAQYTQYPTRPVAISEASMAPSFAPNGIDAEQWRARWFRTFNVQLKRYGYDNVLLFDIQGNGEWDVLGTPAWDAIRAAYKAKPLTNGGFETASNLEDPNGWMKYFSADAATTPTNLSITSGDKRSGSNALRIDGNGRVRQIVSKLTPGQPVTLRAWVKATNGGRASLTAMGYNKLNGAQEAGQSSTSGAWTQLAVTVTPTNSWVVLDLAGAGGTTYFDDVLTSGGTALLANGVYTLTSKLVPSNGGLSQRLGVADGVDQDGRNVGVWDQNNLAPQQWRFVHQGGYIYTITTQIGLQNKVLDADNATGIKAGSNVQIWNSLQRWLVEDAGGGYFYLTPEASINQTPRLRLDVAGGKTTRGKYTDVIVWTHNGHDAQKWKIEAVAGASTLAARSAAAASPVTTADPALSLYPNPSPDGKATAVFSAQQAQTATVQVRDQQGRLVNMLSVPVKAGQTKFKLPATLSKGTYFVQTTLDGQRQRFTLEVE